MDYRLIKQIRDDGMLRMSFMDLAIQAFDLSFQYWYDKGYWTDKYIPYVLANNGRVIASASVNIMDTVWQGEPKRYIQIGTVMTDAAYRGQGLSRRLLEEILADWSDKCDTVYLFANSNVLSFYPKFGFIKAYEHQHCMPAANRSTMFGGRFERLDMDEKYDRETLKRLYQKCNPYSALPMIGNYGLLMFYCGQSMKSSIYYSELIDTVCIAEHHGANLLCYDILGDYACALGEMLLALSTPETEQAILGFTPKNPEGFICSRLNDSENTLFVLNGKENLFANNKAMFPLLSHA